MLISLMSKTCLPLLSFVSDDKVFEVVIFGEKVVRLGDFFISRAPLLGVASLFVANAEADVEVDDVEG